MGEGQGREGEREGGGQVYRDGERGRRAGRDVTRTGTGRREGGRRAGIGMERGREEGRQGCDKDRDGKERGREEGR